MSQWCIVSNEALDAELVNEVIQALKDGGFDVGVCHDGANRVFTSVPKITPELEQYVVRVDANEGVTEQQLIMLVGTFLKANHTDKILIADSSVFTTLFNHPIHRLWCGSHEDKKTLQDDYKAAFGVDDLDGRKSLKDLKHEAKEAVYSIIP